MTLNDKNKSLSASEEAELNQAIQMYYRDKFDESVPVFEKYAAKGNTKAMTFLGGFYDSTCTNSPRTDDKKAFYWYKKAADLGDADAQYYVGLCYVGGIGVSIDEDIAYTWIKKAAKNGSKQAQRELESLYGE